MAYINKNHTLNEVSALIQQSIQKRLDHMQNGFNRQQKYALELFQKRIFLEKTIEEAIAFNKKLVFDDLNKNLQLTKTAEDLLKVFKLRSEVYTDINYQEEFPDTIEGLNFDKYDQTSAILFYKNNKQITGTTRLIFDSKNKLPSEEKYSFNDFRTKYNTIGELSRLIVKHEKKGLNLEFKYLMKAIHTLFMHNDIDITLLGIKKEHYKLYSKFGGSEIVKELKSYGKIELSALILSWDPSKASKFFKKAFLT